MITVERSVLIHHRAAEIRALVEDVESYPKFLPWCAEAKVLERQGGTVVAALTLDFHGIRQSFATSNAAEGGDGLRIRLVSGPFKSLDGIWRFQELSADACKVSLKIDYEFSNALLGRAVGPVFKKIASSLVDAFVQRAEQKSVDREKPSADSGQVDHRGGEQTRG